MRNNNIPLVLGAVGLTVLSFSASAQVTLSGGQLQGLDYSTSGNAFNSVFPSAQYVATAPGYADLTTPDGNNAPSWALVSVPNGYDGVQLGTLASFDAAGAAGKVGFDLASMTGVNGNSAFWEITLIDPKTGTPFTITSINADPDKPGGVPLIGENYFNTAGSGSTMAYTSPQLGNVQALWSVVEGYTPDGSGTADLGTWDVQSVGVEIGIWNTTAAGQAQIDSFTLPGDPTVPDGGMTLTLLGIGLGAMAGLRRRLQRD